LPAIWRVPTLRKVLQHGADLTPARLDALAAAASCPAVASRLPPRLLLELADEHAAHNLAGTLHGYLNLRRQRPSAPLPAQGTLNSIEAIEAATEALLEVDVSQSPMPPPPLPGTSQIIPLKTDQDLIKEGLWMDHCIGQGGFATRARHLLGFGYHVIAAPGARPVATLWIEPSQQHLGAFQIGQLQGPGNSPVSPQVRTLIQRWLSSHAEAFLLRRRGRLQEARTIAPPLHPDWSPGSARSCMGWSRRLTQRARAAGLPRVFYGDAAIPF
jgi:hypothetical protein